LEKSLGLEKEKVRHWQEQLESYTKILHGKGIPAIHEIQEQLQERNSELEKTRAYVQQLKDLNKDLEKKEGGFQDKERVFRQLVGDKEDVISELKKNMYALERKWHESREESDALRSEMKTEIESLTKKKDKEFENRLAGMKRTHQEELERAVQQASEEVESRIRADLPSPGANPQVVEAQIRQQIEAEFMTRLRDQEAELEEKLTQVKGDGKKEMDRIHWENEGLKEELKKTREARMALEREAQEILQQAEEHYKNELASRTAQANIQAQKPQGLFSKIGRFLDTPIIDTQKKDDTID
jgi:F0F1-type ATP synthase membrane subunit b/b'